MNISSRQNSILKTAAPSKAKLDNREFFKNQFGDDFIRNPSKTFALADQYHDKFKLDPQYQRNLQGLTSVNDVLSLSQEVKTPLSKKDQTLYDLKASFPALEKDIDKLGNSNIELQNYDIAIKFLTSTEQDAIDEIISSIDIYQNNKINLGKPLNSFPLLSDLRAYLDDKLSDNKDLYLSKIKDQAVDPKNVDYIYDSPNFLVVLPGTVMSSQHFADNTLWCTGYIKDNMFAHYSSKNIYLYYVITKRDSPRFKSSESKRKMSLGYVKRDGKPILLEDQHATVDSDNHVIRLPDIQNYLGNEANAIISSINADLNGRENTKFEEILKNLSPEEFILTAKTSNIDKALLKSIIEKCENPKTKELAAKNYAEKEPRSFLENFADKYPAYEDITAKNYAENDPYSFLKYFADKYPAYKDIAAKNCAEKSPANFLLDFADKYPAYADIAAKDLAEKDPGYFLLEFADKYPKYADIAAKDYAEKHPDYFLQYFADKYPVYVDIAAKNLAENYQYGFLLDFADKYPAYADIAAKNLAEQYPSDFLQNFANKYPAYADLAAENLAEKEPGYFLQNFANKYPAYADIAAKNLAEKHPDYFLRNFADKYPTYADIAAKNLAEQYPSDFLANYADKYPQYVEKARRLLLLANASTKHNARLIKLANALMMIGLL